MKHLITLATIVIITVALTITITSLATAEQYQDENIITDMDIVNNGGEY